ncbi:MAG: DivIVA domain-containing protein [Actinomycetota bacterium]
MAESQEVFEELGHERFSLAFRGYDRDEVDSYVAEVEELARRTEGHSRPLSRAELSEMVGDEIGAVLAAAEDAAQTIRGRAQREGDETLTAARVEAEKILTDAIAQAATVRDEAETIAAEKAREVELVAERLENAARRRHDEIIEEADGRNKLLEERERELLDRIDALEKAFLSMRHAADDIYKNVARAAPETIASRGEASSRPKPSAKKRASSTDRSRVIDLTDSFEEDEAQIVDVAPTRATKKPK